MKRLHYLTEDATGKRRITPVKQFPATKTTDDISQYASPAGFTYLPVYEKPTEPSIDPDTGLPVEDMEWVTHNPPSNPEGYGWSEQPIQPVVPKYGIVSKRTFFQRLTVFGKWKSFKAILKQNEDLEDDWNVSTGIDPNDAAVIAAAPAIKASIGIDDEQYQSLFLIE